MIEVTVQGTNAILLDFQGDKVSLGILRAMNRAVLSARTVMVRSMAQDTGLKQKDVRDAIRTENATGTRLQAKIAASLKRLPLIKFGARQTAAGVSYKLGGSRNVVPGAFIATVHAGKSGFHTGVFARQPGSTHRTVDRGGRRMRTQLPIVELRGPSLGKVFEKYRPAGIARAQESFATNLAHELKFRASGDTGDDAGTE